MTRINTDWFSKSAITEIYELKDNIDLDPEYQRQGELWSKYKKELFIDSILNGFDIPKLYIHTLQKPYSKTELIKNKDGKDIEKERIIKYTVIDGRQRLETLWDFLENDLKLGDNDILYKNKELNLKGYTYEELASSYPGLRGFFDNVDLPIIEVKTDDDDDMLIEDMFSRLNEAVAINAAEKRNAKQGIMIQNVRSLVGHLFFQTKVSFKNKRLQHHEVSVRFLFLENCIRTGTLFDTKKIFLDRFVDEFAVKDPGFPIYNKVTTVLDDMVCAFDDFDPLLKKQGRSLIYYLLYRQAKLQDKLDNVRPSKIEEFNAKVEENKKLGADDEIGNFDFYQYDRYTIQGTNDASSIKTRFHIIAKYLHLNSDDIDDL